MKHINESIIGRKGAHNASSTAFAKALFRDPKSIFIIYPADNDGYNEILGTLCLSDSNTIEEIYLSGGEVIFIGSGEEFKKLHIGKVIDCDIYMISNFKNRDDAITWLRRNIEYQSDFLKYTDIVKNVDSGEIKF